MVVVITGASAGIGEALARQLSGRGARLVLAARRRDRRDALNALLGGRHLCVTTDVAVREECGALIAQAVERFGRVDTLVCNAGYGLLSRVHEMPPERVDEQFRTNVYGTLDCIRPAVPVMAAQDVRDGGYRGQVMIVSSAAARRGLPYFGIYSATKSAQLSIAESMRVELRESRIAVTTVHPVGTETEFGEAARRAGNTTRRIGPSKGEVRQSADDVARAMVKAIERPRAEVWPLAVSRWMLGAATLVPSWVDRVMAKRVVVDEGEAQATRDTART